MDMLIQSLGVLAGFPLAAKIIVAIVSAAPALAGLITGLVTIWHGVVMSLAGLAVIPGLGKLKDLSERLKASDEKIQDVENSKILPFLNRLSGVSLPKKSA